MSGTRCLRRALGLLLAARWRDRSSLAIFWDWPKGKRQFEVSRRPQSLSRGETTMLQWFRARRQVVATCALLIFSACGCRTSKVDRLKVTAENFDKLKP